MISTTTSGYRKRVSNCDSEEGEAKGFFEMWQTVRQQTPEKKFVLAEVLCCFYNFLLMATNRKGIINHGGAPLISHMFIHRFRIHAIPITTSEREC